MARPAVRTVVAAVERDLAKLAKRDPELADSSLAASALVLAAEMDSTRNSATSKSMCARALIETMKELRGLAPAEATEDVIDELSRRADLKLVGRSAS